LGFASSHPRRGEEKVELVAKKQKKGIFTYLLVGGKKKRKGFGRDTDIVQKR